MIGPVRLGRLAGVPVAADWSWPLLTLLMAGAFYLRVAPQQVSAWPAVALAGAGAVLLMASVLVHELSHAVVARRRGIGVTSVTLFVFGGYTEMEEEPGTPADEFLVAGSGPAASLLLGGLLWIGSLPLSGASGEVLTVLAWINLAVAGFNLLPGLPLDGGRLLRALVWRLGGDGDRASRVAADAGRVLASLVAGVGLFALVARGIALGVVLLVVGWFLYRMAASSRRTAGRLATPVSEVMLPSPAGVDAATEVFAAVPGPPMPVIAERRVIGLIVGPATGGIRAANAMTPLRPSDVVDVSVPIGAVLSRLRRQRRPIVVVEAGRMVGVLSPEQADSWLAEAG